MTFGNKRLDNLVRLISAVGLLLKCAMTLQVAIAQEPPPGTAWTPYPNIGSCTNCREYQWTSDDGILCTKVVCIDPRWEAGLCFANLKCVPFETTGCGVTGVERCSYTCKDEKTYNPPVCTVIGNGGNFRKTFCDYNAGCPNDPGGFVNGKPVTINMLCTQNGVQQTITSGICGEGGCKKHLICKPGKPCCRPGIDPGCTESCTTNGEEINITPRCGPGGAGYQCTFGKVTVSVPLPCPTVMRKPFPRAIVGQPVSFSIIDGCSDLPSASNRTDIGPPYNECGDTIFAYEGQLAWICSKPDMSDAEWTMDERSWNVGQTNSAGTILSTRTGSSANHVYETSSYDKAPNGPGYPEMSKRQPAYQVQLKTNYSLVGAFKYHYRTTASYCYWGANQSGGTKKCYDPGACANDPNRANREDCQPDGSSGTVIISPTREMPSFIIGNISVTGAKTPQDLANPNSCGVIATSVIQSQAVLQP